MKRRLRLSASFNVDVTSYDAEYPLSLAYAALTIRTLAQRLDRKLLLGEATERFLVVGFDSGDSMVIGRLCTDGLRSA